MGRTSTTWSASPCFASSSFCPCPWSRIWGLPRVEEHAGGFRIRGYGCPLAAATLRHPEACNAVESLLSDFAGVPVAMCCDSEDRLRRCFEIGGKAQVT